MTDGPDRSAAGVPPAVQVRPLTHEAAESLCEFSRSLGFSCAHVDLLGCETKEDFLARTAAALQFPDWFGGNWDAYFDCLADLSWRPATGHLVILENAGALRRAAPEAFDTAVAIFEDAAKAWQRRKVPFRAYIGVD